MPKYSIIFILVTTLLAAQSAMANLGCQNIFHDTIFMKVSSAEKDFETANKIQIALSSGRLNYSVKTLANRTAFKAYLNAKGISDSDIHGLPEAKQKTLLGQYVGEIFSKYRNPEKLRELQNDSIINAISKRSSENLSLIDLSTRNKERLLTALQVPNSKEMLEAKSSLENIELYFSHNTNIPLKDRDLETPLLSSKQLHVMGSGYGLNSTNLFNREILNTGDQVFFFVGYKRKNTKLTAELNNEYGKNTLDLDTNYANKHGWVSFFIMYPEQLINFMETHSPKLKQQMEDVIQDHSGIKLYYESLSQQLTRDRVWQSILQNEPELINKIHEGLGLLDFTLTDFDLVWRAIALHELHRVQTTDPEKFTTLIQQLNSENTVVENTVHKLVNKSFGDKKYGFELKIPVAVDHKALTAR